MFYVGIGTGYRPRRFSGRNKMWERIVKKYGFRIEIVHKELTWEEACEYEKRYIKQFGRRSLRQGSLANLTDGGDGAVGNDWNIGSKRTPEQRKKISDALKGRKVEPEALANSVAARKRNHEERVRQGIKRPKRFMTDEQKHKISMAKMGHKRSPELIKRHADMLRGRKRSPEVVENLRQKLKGVPKSEEHRRKLSEATKQQWVEKRTWYYQ